MTPLRIVFLGSDPIALPLLDWLWGDGGANWRLAAVFTQPDRAVGRGQKITANEIKTWALGRNLPVYQPGKLTADVRTQLAELGADLSLVMAYGHILRDEFIATPRLGTLNLHASILPLYRGASPIQAAIANGEKETGVSLMRVVRRLDAGPVADVERVPILPLDTAAEIEGKLSAACVPLLARNLARVGANTLTFVEQVGTDATYCRRLAKADGALDFHAPPQVVASRINGLFPWPACQIDVLGHEIKVGLADVTSADVAPHTGALASQLPGEVAGADSLGLLVRAGHGIVRLRRLQRPGGRMLAAADFLRGQPILKGTLIASRSMPVLVSAAPFKA